MDTQKGESRRDRTVGERAAAYDVVALPVAPLIDAEGAAGMPMVELGKRVRACRGEINQDQFAQQLGVHPNTMGKFERGITEPSALQALKIAQLGGRSVNWLLTGEEAGVVLQGAALVEHSLRAVEIGSYVYVPHFDVRLSGGHGAFNDIAAVKAMRPFAVDFVRHELGIKHNELVMCDIRGNSMAPHIKDRDTAMLDLRDTEVLTEGMHAVRMNDALLVKTLQRLPGILRVTSNNDSFQPFDVKGEGMDDLFKVIGRAVWGGIIFK